MVKKIVLFFILIMSVILLIKLYSSAGKTIYIVPFHGSENDSVFCDPCNPKNDGHPYCELFRKFIECGYKVKATATLKNLPDVAYIICFNMPTSFGDMMQDLDNYPKDKCWVILWEPPVVKPHDYNQNNCAKFGKVFTVFDDMVDNTHFYKLHYPQTSLAIVDPVIDFDKKKFCTATIANKHSNHSSELYSARKKTLDFFEKLDSNDFEFYGTGWQGSNYKNYRGIAPSKTDCLKNYKFCICYENMGNQQGYITEKIFEVMIAGCVPIYYGATNIGDYVPKDCFIAREQFENEEALHAYLKNIDKDTYNAYIDRIKAFLVSEQIYPFSTKGFIDTFMQALNK